MWRRRREKARAGAARTDAVAPGGIGIADNHPPGRIPAGLPERGRVRGAWTGAVRRG